jgi:hypothetical protein
MSAHLTERMNDDDEVVELYWPLRDNLPTSSSYWRAGDALYRVVDTAFECSSAMTSNLHPSGFDTIMPKTLATATVDRLLHHAHVVPTEAAHSVVPKPPPDESGALELTPHG